jgi:hypothetical protein
MNEWFWLRVYYFEACKDDLILDAVWPAVLLTKSSGFFRRTWSGGPNVLVGLKQCDSAQAAEGVKLIDDYLRLAPSTTELNQSDYQRSMQMAASWEAKSSQADLQPNNTVLVDCEEPEAPLLGTGELKQEVYNFLCQSSPMVTEWLSAVRNGESSKQQIAFEAMIGLAWISDPDTLHGAISYGSHAGGFLRGADPNKKIARIFQSRYAAADGEVTRKLLRTTVERLRGNQDGLSPAMGKFLDLLRTTLSNVHEGLIQGRLRPKSVRELLADQTFGTERMPPEIHRKLVHRLDESPALKAWQITINLLYLALNQLGIAPLDRFFMCYILFRAAEDEYGRSGEQIALRLADTGDSREMLPFFSEDFSKAAGQIRFE